MKYQKLRKHFYNLKYHDPRKNALFSDLSDADFDKLMTIARKIRVKKDEYFIHEGKIAEDFYFILSGKIAITKSDDSKEHEHAIAHLESGDIVGELALLDHKPRSASAKAIIDTELIRFPFDKLKILAEESTAIDQILEHIIDCISSRMRQTNTAVVSALEKQLHEYKKRVALGTFMINNIVALCLFAFFLSWVTDFTAGAVATTVISVPLTLGFMVLFFSIMRSSELPLETFGLTTKNWRLALKESALFTIIVCLFVQVFKWVLTHTTEKYMGHPVFSPFLAINLNKSTDGWSYQTIWLIILVVYCLIISPLQELITRGGLQGPLEVLLAGKHTRWKAIIVSNFMFSTVHLFMGVQISIMVFFAGLYFGWLYSRHHTLIGVIFAHALLGTWATMVVGF